MSKNRLLRIKAKYEEDVEIHLNLKPDVPSDVAVKKIVEAFREVSPMRVGNVFYFIVEEPFLVAEKDE